MDRSSDVTKKRWAKQGREQQAQAEKPAAADAAAATDQAEALQTIPSAAPSSSAYSDYIPPGRCASEVTRKLALQAARAERRRGR